MTKKDAKYEKIRNEFLMASSENEISKLVFKYGDKADINIQKICREFMKYDTETASSYISRDPDTEYSFLGA